MVYCLWNIFTLNFTHWPFFWSISSTMCSYCLTMCLVMLLLTWSLGSCLAFRQLMKIVASNANFLTSCCLMLKCLFFHYQVPCLLSPLVSVLWPLWVKCQLEQGCFFLLYLTFLENLPLGRTNKHHFQTHIFCCQLAALLLIACLQQPLSQWDLSVYTKVPSQMVFPTLTEATYFPMLHRHLQWHFHSLYYF